LNHAFEPLHLEVINESNRHHVPPNSETHFKVVVVSDKFSDQL
jgi:BolA protein